MLESTKQSNAGERITLYTGWSGRGDIQGET